MNFWIDAQVIRDIYNYYISNTLVTFEEELVSADEMAQRISEALTENLPWLVAEDEGGKVMGYAHASKWKGRCAYRYSVEVTVYLAQEALSQGWGTSLYRALFAELKEKSIHTVIAGIALPNPVSIVLHEKWV